MIKFAQDGKDGRWGVFLGITTENLVRISELQPVVFPAEDVGLGDGMFLLGTGGMAKALQAQLGRKSTVRGVELTQDETDRLVEGDFVSRSLESLGFDRAGLVHVFLGPSEEVILEGLRASGLVTDATRIRSVDAAPVEVARKQPSASSPIELKPSLILTGLFFTAMGAASLWSGKSIALGLLITLAGLAITVWGFRYRPPRPR